MSPAASPSGCCGKAVSLSHSPVPSPPSRLLQLGLLHVPSGCRAEIRRLELSHAFPLAPVFRESPSPKRSRQWVTPGRSPPSCFPCALPTPWCVGLLSQFLQMTPVCVCHLFLSGAPADAPAAPGGWSCLQSLSPVVVRSNQRGCTAELGERSYSSALRPFFSENMPLQRHMVMMVVVVEEAVALCPLTTSLLLC